MKTLEFNINAKNEKKEEVNLKLSISHDQVNGKHEFCATIVDSDKEVVWGDNPTGFYSDGNPISKVAIKSNSILFGTGQVERQATYPFVLYGEKKGKKHRFMFQLPVDKKTLLESFKFASE